MMMGAQNGSTLPPGESYREKVRTHAATRLTATTPETDPATVSGTLRRFLKVEEQRLKMAHYIGAPGCETAAARSLLPDSFATDPAVNGWAGNPEGKPRERG